MSRGKALCVMNNGHIPPEKQKQFRGHPIGLYVLFFTEMWERFSFYGMRGLLKLYMVCYLFVNIRQTLQGGAYNGSGDSDTVIGWSFIKSLLPTLTEKQLAECVTTKAASLIADNSTMAANLARQIAEQACNAQPQASVIYGWYTGLVYLTPIIGGLIADRWLGQRKTVIVGGILMAMGHFVMAIESSFFIALGLLILGNGAFKPNISTQVGRLYPEGDKRRDGAFTIFYMGINLGAVLCSFVCGTLAAVLGWHYGFAAAGVGMGLGLVVYLLGGKYLAREEKKEYTANTTAPMTGNEWGRVWALCALCVLNVVFWAVYEQQGNTMQTWADEQTVWPVILGFQIPSTWFQSFNPLCIFLFAPFLDMFWAYQARQNKAPTSVTKMAIGSIILGLSFIVMIIGTQYVGTGKGSAFWPLFCALLLTVGELYLSPIGLSLVTKVSPARIVSMMMGIWLLSSFFGNILSGYIGVLYTTWGKTEFFILLTVLGVATGLVMWLFNKPLKRALGEV